MLVERGTFSLAILSVIAWTGHLTSLLRKYANLCDFSRRCSLDEEDETTKLRAVGCPARIATCTTDAPAQHIVTREELLKVMFLEAIEKRVRRETSNQQQQELTRR